jgi:PAS domain S-box-containing protein
MRGLVEEFDRFANLFAEPIVLVSTASHLYAANAVARADLFEQRALEPEQLLLAFLSDDPAKVFDYLRACARSAQPLPGLLRFRRHDAVVEFRCLGSSFRVRDEQQRALVVLRLAAKQDSTNRFVALNQQIDQLRAEVARRVRAERQAEEQRQLLLVTLSSIGDAVLTTDVNGHITFVNGVAETHLGRSSADCVGRPLEAVFVIRDENSGQSISSPVHEVLKTGAVVGLANHTVLVRPNGTELAIDDSAAPIRDASGKLFGVILVFRETGESRRLQRELLEQTTALREADRRKDQFLAVLAHELRNPLAPLRNGLQIVRLKMQSDQTLQRTVEMMERQLVHLVRLVNDLMDVSRVSRGVIELRNAPVCVADILARSVEAIRADIEVRGHRLHFDLPSESIRVMGDADRLTQVFSNLLGNSAKYSPNGGHIRLSVTPDGHEVVISVSDNGIGIPPDQLERVFDIFSQVRAHQVRAEGGLGIGLSLVRTLVVMHGGTVNAQSDGPNSGSTFTVRLPRLRQWELITPPAALAIEPVASDLRILVADDNTDAAISLRLVLEGAGHDVRTAANGHEAVRQVADFAPHLVFMDIGMPELDGVEATRLIRQQPNGADMVIVALTGWGQLQDRDRTRAAGVNRHIVKPISPEEITEILALAARSGNVR